MKDALLPLPFPIGGLNLSTALDAQPPLTTPIGLNVRSYEPRSGRNRGGQRGGQSKYCTGRMNGANGIQDINQAVHTAGTSVPGSLAKVAASVGNVAGSFFDWTAAAGIWSTLLLAQDDTDLLGFSTFDFAAIPANATIVSVAMTISRKATGTIRDGSGVKFTKAGAAVGGELGVVDVWPVDYGPATYLSDVAWTVAEVQGAGFQFRATSGGGSGTPFVDAAGCSMTVVYQESASLLSLRTVRAIAVSAGTIVRFTPSAVVTLTGGSGALSATAPVIFSSQLLDKLYFVDGSNYKYYDCATDTILTLTASAGSLPVDASGNKARLICNWHNRLTFSGLPGDARNWFMAAQDDPSDHDYNPTPSVETQAVAGNNTDAGLCPDIINSLLSYSNEVLIFGSDHSIYQLNGDPMAGGRIDLLTDTTGMAWGRPFCRDPRGTLYFFSTRGVGHSMAIGSPPEPLSQVIAELLQAVNLSTHIVRMAWDERQVGFQVWITAIGAVTATFHFWFDARNNAWWMDQYADVNMDPIAVHVFDGDTSDDRAILMGGRDSYIRMLDEDALDDDGEPIESYVLLGPIRDKKGSGMTLADLQVSLGENSGAVNYAVHAGADAQSAVGSAASVTGLLTVGRNRSQAVRVFGHSLFIKLEGLNVANTAWSLEWVRARVLIPEGKARQRNF